MKPRLSGLRVLFAYRSEVEDPRGGAATVMLELARELRQMGLDVDVSFEGRPDPAGYDLVQVFNAWHPNPALRQLRHLRDHDVPIVWFPFYLHWCEWVWANRAVRAIFSASTAEADRKKFIAALTNGTLDVDNYSQWKRNEVYPGFHRDLAEMVRLVDHVCVTSHREVQMLAQVTGWDRKPFTVTPHGVNPELIRTASADDFISRYGVRDFVLCVAAVDARKNQLLLTEAVADSGLTLVLCGPCAELDYLELCQIRGRDRILCTGRLSREAVSSAYLAARVHALPSFAEGAALSNLEAAVAGRALVVSNRSSEFEYFGSDPYYVDPVDIDGISRAVRAAYDGFPAEQERWRNLGKRIEERFTWRRSAELTLEAYEEVLGAEVGCSRQRSDGQSIAEESEPVRPVSTTAATKPRSVAPAGRELGINLFGPISSNIGSGTAARQYLRMFLESGVKVHAVDLPIGGGRSLYHQTYAKMCHKLDEKTPYPVNLFIRNPDDLALYMSGSSPAFQLEGRVNISLPFWELSRIPAHWIPHLRQMDVVIAANDFIKYALLADLSGTVVRSSPHPMYLDRAERKTRKEWGISERKLAFVTSFEISSDVNRKNPYGVIEAFKRAFTPQDDVLLVMKVNNPRGEVGYEQHLEALAGCVAGDRRVRLVEEALTYEETLSLWGSCDVYVSLHRAEGLGLPMLEAMSLGKPVIATGWSGNLDFMNEQNSCLIGYELIPVHHSTHPGYTEDSLGGGMRWADPDLNEAAIWMRRLARDEELRRSIGKRAAAEMAERQRSIGPEEIIAAAERVYRIRGLRI
jgi:glycosyltransferase involved in cell wall biosynthesis